MTSGKNIYEQVREALAPVVALTPPGTPLRYEEDEALLRSYLSQSGRDEAWAYTITTALAGLDALLRYKFEAAEAAFTSVIEQCRS